MKKEILYITDNRLDKTYLGKVVKEYLLKSGLPIISVSLAPINFGNNIHYIGRRCHSTLIKQVYAGLMASTADYIFIGEHDVLYHKSHFDFAPPRDDIYYYNNNVWRYRPMTGQVIHYDCKWFSQLCASRKLLVRHYEKRIALLENKQRAYGFEPGAGQNRSIDGYKSENFESEYPNIDIKHGRNWTGVSGMSIDEYKDKNVPPNWKEVNVDKISGWNKEVLSKLRIENYELFLQMQRSKSKTQKENYF